MNQKLDIQYYEILGINAGASQEEIEQAYRKACSVYSEANPEFASSFRPEEAQELRGWVEEAYRALRQKNEEKQIFQFEKEVSLEAELIPEFEHELFNATFFDGLLLKKVRLKKNISLNYIANKTCIGIHHLIAIEANDFDSLPAAVFVRSYVKQIAQILGLNIKDVSESYMKLYQDSREQN